MRRSWGRTSPGVLRPMWLAQSEQQLGRVGRGWGIWLRALGAKGTIWSLTSREVGAWRAVERMGRPDSGTQGLPLVVAGRTDRGQLEMGYRLVTLVSLGGWE